MPEYLAPGVYVEETSFRPKTIEGVSTSTAAFIGPTRYGPTEGEPELLTSFADFERMFGGLDELVFGGSRHTNFVAHAVRAFFEEGGRRCYVARVYDGSGAMASNASSSPPSDIAVTARFPGAAGNMRVTFTPRLSRDLLVRDPITGTQYLSGVEENDTVYIETTASPPAGEYFDVVRDAEGNLELRAEDASTTAISSLTIGDDVVQRLTVDVTVERPIVRPKRPGERFDVPTFLEGFNVHPADPRSLAAYFHRNPASRALSLTVPIAVEDASSPPDATGIAYAEALFGDNPSGPVVVTLTNGADGGLPPATGNNGYEGRGGDDSSVKSGFRSLEDHEDVSIVAAPGYSHDYDADATRPLAIQALLVSHCERMRYRIAVLDAPNGQNVSGARDYRGKIDSKYAALYYPWVTILDPVTEEELNLPPSGFVAGIYARNDVERGVQKAPANERVRMAIGFEFLVNKAQQEALNPDGINCFRFFEGRGYLLWGGRAATSDGEWKYVNLRRYFAYLERSIDKGTQVFVFESNAERLWANVRRTIEDFLMNEWKSGRLMGLTPEEAFFVRCDRSTMTQNDIDNGRLICLIGVAPLRPAEFVIFRIGQKLLETRAA